MRLTLTPEPARRPGALFRLRASHEKLAARGSLARTGVLPADFCSTYTDRF